MLADRLFRGGATSPIVVLMTEKLTAADWVGHGLKQLAGVGPQALKADLLARSLRVTRGSFYWHFADLAAFHQAVADHWRAVATDAIIAEISHLPDDSDRLFALIMRVFKAPTVLEAAMRAWAGQEVVAARAVTQVDDLRRGYIMTLLQAKGVEESLARLRTNIIYWTYLGFVVEGRKIDTASLSVIAGLLSEP